MHNAENQKTRKVIELRSSDIWITQHEAEAECWDPRSTPQNELLRNGIIVNDEVGNAVPQALEATFWAGAPHCAYGLYGVIQIPLLWSSSEAAASLPVEGDASNDAYAKRDAPEL